MFVLIKEGLSKNAGTGLRNIFNETGLRKETFLYQNILFSDVKNCFYLILTDFRHEIYHKQRFTVRQIFGNINSI